MFSLGKARNTLERWFRHEDDGASAHGASAGHGLSRDGDSTPDQRVEQFMQELEASSQEWLGRVRMIRFDSIRERVGPRWAKLQDRVEILAEKIIQEEMAPRDRYVNAGDAEFLVFFADATPEESRIRCLAIVEMIHEKLFGIEDGSGGSPQKIAECHVVHRNDLILEWEMEACGPGGTFGGSAGALGRAFRHDPELLEPADIAQSTQAAIGSILSCGGESKDASELAPLLTRLRYLSRSLKVLEPALLTSLKEKPDRRHHMPANAPPQSADGGRREQSGVAPLGTAWDDIVEVIAVLDVGSHDSHADMLESLRKLQHARQERAASAPANNDLSARAQRKGLGPGQFGYLPVYRCVSQGERIHQGLYRLTCSRLEPRPATGDDDAMTRDRRQAVLERMILEHAIRYLLDRRTGKGFALLAPVGVETLGSPSAQRQYSTVLRSAQLRVKRRLLMEVTGYSLADHTLGMRRAIDELRLHCRAIFITVSARSARELERIALECKELGAHAIGMDASQFCGEGKFLGALSSLASIGAQHSVLTYVNGINSVAILAKAIASGISYVCAPGLRPALRAPEDAERASFDDLYSAI